MLFVKHHIHNIMEPEGRISHEEEMIKKNLQKLPGESDRLERIAKRSIELSTLYLVHRKDEPAAKRYFKLAQRSLSWHFVLCSNPGKTIEVNLGAEHRYQLVGKENVTSGIDNSDWMTALYMSVIARDMESVRLLLEVEESLMRKTQLIGPAYWYVYVDFLKSYFRNAPDVGQKLITAYKSADVRSIVDDEEAESVRLDLWPMLQTFEALMRKDLRGFNQLLIDQLQRHYRVCRDENPDFPLGLISYPLTMFGVLALDRGWELAVLSDYMPNFMLLGDFT